jgi:phage terminase small subunit
MSTGKSDCPLSRKSLKYYQAQFDNAKRLAAKGLKRKQEMPRKDGNLTPQEKRFAEVYAVTNDPTYAAVQADYGSPRTKGLQKLQVPGVQAEIHRHARRILTEELGPKALAFLGRVLDDEKENTRNRITAAKIVIDKAYGPGADPGAEKEAHEMTQEEALARIAELRRIIAENAAVTIEATPIEPPKPDVFG